MLDGTPLPDLEELEIQGRKFRPTPDDEVVFEQYAMIHEASSRCGMGQELLDTFSPYIEAQERGEAVDAALVQALSERVLVRAFRDRAYLDLLAGLLNEVGKEWTPERAKANRDFFARAKGPDVPKLHTVLVYAILAFFGSGIRSSRISPKSSALSAAGVDLVPKDHDGGAGTESTGT